MLNIGRQNDDMQHEFIHRKAMIQELTLSTKESPVTVLLVCFIIFLAFATLGTCLLTPGWVRHGRDLPLDKFFLDWEIGMPTFGPRSAVLNWICLRLKEILGLALNLKRVKPLG